LFLNILKPYIWHLLLIICAFGVPCMSNDLKPVSPFILNSYLGKWYEIARLPAWFEKDMTHVTATYTLNKNGMVKVENAGLKNGKPTKAIGKATFAGDTNAGRLKVAFFLSFYADYVVLNLDSKNYQYAMVASSYKYLWILSRKPTLDKSIVDALLEKAKKTGFNTNALYFTPQIIEAITSN
jgi:apolipoprotein D and lipocalin family protein